MSDDYEKSLGTVLSTYEGRHVLWEIMARCRTFVNSFNADSSYTTAHNLGKQAIGQGVLGDINEVSDVLFNLMQKENAARVENERIKNIKEKEEKSK